MLKYNTAMQQLALPEYGRNIQQMVDHCLTIADRDERTKCAFTIIKVMGNLFPELRSADNEHKLWDHLIIMSGFNLDIDFPCEVVSRESLDTKPEKVPYTQGTMRYRHYGQLTGKLVAQISEMPENDDRKSLIALLANQMKKQMLAVNPDGVEDERIFADIREMSHGKILVNAAELKLNEYKELAPVGKKRKKKQ